MAKSEMVRVTIYLTPEQAKWLEHTAKTREVSESQVMRELLDRYLAQERPRINSRAK